jgi:hypothetical protein
MRTIQTIIMISAFVVSTASSQDYFPLKAGNQWTYAISDGTSMTMKVTGDANVNGVRCTIVETDISGQTNKAYYVMDSNGLKDYKLENSYRELVYNPPILRIKLPFVKGQRWTCKDGEFTTNFESVGNEKIQTQAGNFQCIVIRSSTVIPEQSYSLVIDNYYAAGQGFVYQKVINNGQESITNLTSSNIQPSQIPARAIEPNSTQPEFEKYLSPVGNLMLFKPHDWNVIESNRQESGYAATIANPQETAVVMFMALPLNEQITNSVILAKMCIAEFGTEFTDFKATSIKSTPDKDRTIMEITFTDEGKKGLGHGYFFYTKRIGTIYLLLAPEDQWNQMRTMLTNIAVNIAYTPDGIPNVTEHGSELAAQTPAPQGRVLSPAAMLQQAKNRPGRQLTLYPKALSDSSLSLQIPQGWNVEGQEAKYLLYDNPQTRNCGMTSISYSIIPTEISVPGVINAPYQPPPQALKLIMQFTQSGSNLEILGEIPGEHALPELATTIQNLRMQGLQVDSRLLHVKYKNPFSGATLRGLFSVQCSMLPMSPVWQISMDGSWAPENELEDWIPLYLRIGATLRVNQQWAQADMQNRNSRQRQLNRNLQNSIAGANQAFDQYMDSVQNSDRSRDYSSWMWSQTTLGQGTWLAENEGAQVYRTDAFGIEGPQGRVDSPAYNTTSFTGENPWGGNQLELVDTRVEYENYRNN